MRLVVAVGWGTFRQRFLIVALAVSIQKWLVDQILGDQHVGDTFNQSRIGTWTNGEPLILFAEHGIGVTGINNNGTNTTFAYCRDMLKNFAPTAHTCFGWVVTKHDEQLGIFDLSGETAKGRRFGGTIGKGHGKLNLAPTIVAIVGQVATDHIHKALERMLTIGAVALSARAIGQEDGIVAIFFNGVLELVSHQIESFVPSDAFKARFTTLPNTLHWIFQAIGIVDAPLNRTTTQASTDLVLTKGLVITTII